MPVSLPLTPGIAYDNVRTTLDGVAYSLDVRWNSREDAFYIDISDQFSSPIFIGMKVVLGCALGSTCQDPRFPPGILMPVDTDRSMIDASFADFGTRIIVLYYSAAELGL